MKDVGCEKVLMAVMAEADGERGELSPAEINTHLTTCADCRHEVVRMQQALDIFRRGARAETTADLWPAVSSRLPKQTQTGDWKTFAGIGVLLLACKLFELVPVEDPGWTIKMVPLAIFGALIFLIKENPFRINSELILEK